MFEHIRAITTEDEYEQALVEIRPYFDDEPDPGTEAAARFDALALLISHYEDQHHPVPDVGPIEVLKFIMETNDYSQADLGRLLGSRSRASEILSGQRDLNLEHIRKLSHHWHIPADALIGAPKMAYA